MKAKDIMESTKDVLTPDTTIREAVAKMRMAVRIEAKGLSGVKAMVVEDRPGHLAGILSMSDILRAIIPWYLKEGRVAEFTWDGMLEAMVRKVADKKVGDLMNRNVITVDLEAPLMECAELMVKSNLQRIPVVDRDGTLRGIVYLRDLYHAFVRVFAGEDK